MHGDREIKHAYRLLHLVIVVFIIMLFFSHATTCRKTFSNLKMVGSFVCSGGECLFMCVSSALILLLLLQLHVRFNRMETEKTMFIRCKNGIYIFWNFIRPKNSKKSFTPSRILAHESCLCEIPLNSTYVFSVCFQFSQRTSSINCCFFFCSLHRRADKLGGATA